MELRTERLLLRPWRDDDLPAWAAINADPVVMEYFPATLSREESDARAARNRAHMDEHGFGPWAVEVPGEAAFIGYVGMYRMNWPTPFQPDLELAWRLARGAWGRGYASEAARAVAAHAFGKLGFDEVVAVTATGNWRSRRVMETIGMVRDVDGDFDHPRVPDGNPIKRHVLYRLKRDRPTQDRPTQDRPTQDWLKRA